MKRKFMKIKFKVGDKVQLNNGSPDMAVLGSEEIQGKIYCLVCWIGYRNAMKTKVSNQACFKAVK